MNKFLFGAFALFCTSAFARPSATVPSVAPAQMAPHGFDLMAAPGVSPMQKDSAAFATTLQSPAFAADRQAPMLSESKQQVPAKVILDNTKSLGTGEYHYVPQMFGGIVADDGDVVKRPKFRFGMYKLPTGHQQSLDMVCKDVISRYGGVRIDNVYYNVTQWGPAHEPTYYLRKYDIDTWTMTEEITLKDASLYSDCVAADPTTGYVYGCFRTNGVNAGGWEICIADFKNKSPYKLPALHKCTSAADRWNACAFTTDGTLYAINMKGDLLKIDKQKGTGTVVGATGLTPYNIGSAMVDPDSGRMYYFGSLADLSSAIYEIDLTTGKATKALLLPDGLSLSGVVPAVAMPAQGAPGRIADATYTFTDGNLQGTLQFTAPSKTFGGKTLSGSLAYAVLDGERQIASGNVMAGQKANVTLAVDTSGLHDLCLYLTNTAGRSPRHFTHRHIGNDRPCRVDDVKLVYNDATGDVALSWSPVGKSENDAFFRPDEVKYRVTDAVSGKVVADGLGTCSLTTNIKGAAEMKNRPFRVEALFRDQVSAPRESNPAVPGSAKLPFVDTFDNIEFIPDGYHVINVAEDLNTWTTYLGVLMCHMSPLGIDMDDWLFTPPLYLEAGKIYQVSADMASRFNSCTERIEVLWGDNNHPSAMTHTGLAAFDLVPGGGMYVKYNNYSFTLVPERTGIHYVGFHGISKADEGSIFLDNLTVSSAITPGTPQAVTDLSVTPAAKGAHKATIAFKTPSVDVEGKPLESISRIEIERDGKLVATIAKPAVGAPVSYTDTMKYGGWKEYLVTPYNENGAGQINRKSAFIGAYVPSAVTGFSAVETRNPGEVLLRWTPPTKDVYGAELTPEDLTYNLYRSRGDKDELVMRGIEGDSLLYRACDPENRDFLLFGIKAVSATGEGPAEWSEMIPIGKPHPLPFRFSFTDADFARSPIVRRYISDVTWEVANDTTISGIQSADGDGSFAYLYAYTPDTQAALLTGKIGLPEQADVMMSVMVYNLKSASMGNNTNTLEVLASAGNGQWTTLRKIEIGQLPKEGWNKVLLPLRKFAGAGVQLQFLATCATYPLLMIDDIRVDVNTERDLAVEAIEGPANTRMGREFDLNVRLRNNSATPQADYTLKVMVNGDERINMKGTEIAEGGSLDVPFRLAFLPHDPKECTVKAIVECAGDSHADNNVSAELKIGNGLPRFNAPVAGRLHRDAIGAPVQLEWDAPSIAGNVPDPIEENFEDFTPWIANPDISPWSLYDGDKGGIGGFDNYVLPGQIKKGTQQSFWVMDDRGSGLNQTFAANSGHKYLAQMYTGDLSVPQFTPIDCDDRLISPELFGCEQTISFYARSYVYSMLETFELMTSTTGNAPADFTTLARVEQAPADWRRYEYTLPEGTRYFAIRCVSHNKFMFFIDDVECIAADAEPFTLLGYNVYRDGRRLNSAPVADTRFTDNTVGDAKEAVYYVTAVYNHGESVASNSLSLSLSGIEQVVDPARSIVAVYTLDGRRLGSLPESGICVVRYSDGSTAKVNIK